MKVFVTGTDTEVGKTLVCRWICANTGFPYWKPIQSGSMASVDSNSLRDITKVYPEIYSFKAFETPYLAAKLENTQIDLTRIKLPDSKHLVIEGAGGVFVNLNESEFIIDLIKMLHCSVLVVARSGLGTINHTLLTIRALKEFEIPILGIILNGLPHEENKLAIERHTGVPVLAQLPAFPSNPEKSVLSFDLPASLLRVLGDSHVTA